MPIKVHFRGPMLFVSDKAGASPTDNVVNRILIPDSTQGKHEDGSNAKPHFAAMLVIEPGKRRAYIPLAGRQVTISANGEKGAPRVDKKFCGVPPIHEMTNPSVTGARTKPVRRRKKPDAPPATITFKGGSMSGRMLVKNEMELMRHKAKPLPWDVTAMPLWKSDAKKGTVRISGGEGGTQVIDIDKDTQIYIFNWDVPFPTKGALTDTAMPSDTPDDEDFKWVYRLLKPGSGTWKQWLAGEKGLPTPRVIKRPKKFTPSLPTCNSAWAVGFGAA